MPETNPGGTFSPVKMVFTVDLVDFPEWAIPFTKIIPKVHLEDTYDVQEIADSGGNNFVTNCRHLWKMIDENHWQIYVELTARAIKDGVYLPTFVDVDLVIFNENVFEEINSNKV